MKIRQGSSDHQVLDAMIPSDQPHLRYSLRRFKNQKWLITLQQRGDLYLIMSAYGLGLLEEKMANPLPIPLASEPEDFPELNHGRASTHHYEAEVVELVNQERWDNGQLPPLKDVSELHSSSDGHSDRMANLNFFAHCDLEDGDSPWDRMAQAGYNLFTGGENIAAGQSDPASVMSAWMGSSGHRANILSSNFREIGVGYEYNGGGSTNELDFDGNCNADNYGGPYHRYWTQNFGSRNGVFPVIINREAIVATSQTVNLFIYDPGGASQMRFRNESGSWSAWINYNPDHTWQLSAGNGQKTVYSEVRTSSGQTYTASDVIELNGNCAPMEFSNQTLSGAQTYQSCEIIANPNVTITGQITFDADNVQLGSNVEVRNGASLEIRVSN